MTIVAYITDLFFQAKVDQTAQLVGADLKLVSSLPQLGPALEVKPAILVLDLNASGIRPGFLIAEVKQKDPDLIVIAYVSHVQTDLIQEARQAGADQVLARSEFSRRLPEILSGDKTE